MRRVALARLAAAAAALTLVGAAGCGGAEGSGDGTPRAVTTTNFITDTVRQVAGERFDVVGLMGPGVDPHLYRPSAGDVETLRGADIIFHAGLELEGRMGDLLARMSETEPVVAVSEAVPADELIEAEPDEPEEHDPHVWLDPGLWAHAVAAVRDGLSEVDPAGVTTYEANARAMLEELDELEGQARRALAQIPAEHRVLVTSHDAFEYFGRAFDVDVAAIQGISTDAEASTADIERVARVVAERGVPAVFIESTVPRQTIDAVLAAAERLGQPAVVGGELFGDAAGPEGTPEGTYVGMIRANVETIVEGLR